MLTPIPISVPSVAYQGTWPPNAGSNVQLVVDGDTWLRLAGVSLLWTPPRPLATQQTRGQHMVIGQGPPVTFVVKWDM